MHTISRDSPCYYLTAVAKDRLSIFRSDKIKSIACSALNEARASGSFSLYAYVVMPDHIHAVTDSVLRPSKILQFRLKSHSIMRRRYSGDFIRFYLQKQKPQ